MKLLSLFLLSTCTISIAMEVNLDDEALREFTHNKQKMIAVAQGRVLNSETNNFWKTYNELGKLDKESARTQFNRLKAKSEIKDFFSTVIWNAEYQTSLADAKKGSIDEAWRAFRLKSAEISKAFLVKHSINCDKTEEWPTANHFNQNAHLSEKQIELLTASSYLLYYNRNVQRTATGKTTLPEIEITK